MVLLMALVIILLVVGGILLLLETMLPGMVAGVIGGCCLIAGIFLSYSRFDARTANLILVVVLMVLVGGFAGWIKFFPDTRVGRVFVSKRVVGNIYAQRPELLHQAGVAYSPLRPSGTALINGKRVDVVTEGPFVEGGMPIKVVAIEGVRVIVRAVNDQTAGLINKPINS